jgi:hypothetical protein
MKIRAQVTEGEMKPTNDDEALQLRTTQIAAEYDENAVRIRKIVDLETHPEPYVTMLDLARYWRVSQKQIYRQIETGMLRATVLGPMLRICTLDALRFEDMAMMPLPTLRETTTLVRGNALAAAAGQSASTNEGGQD